MGRAVRVKGLAGDGEVFSPPRTVWITTLCGALVAVGAIAAAIWNHLTPDVYGEGLTDAIAVGATLFAVWSAVAVRVTRTRLTADAVERQGVFSRRDLPRSEIVGYRILPDAALCLVSRPGRDLVVTKEVLANPVWVAWLESLTSLDEQDTQAAQAAIEADGRLGHTPVQRREKADTIRRLGGALTLAGIALGLWLLWRPRPYELAVCLNALAPLIALGATARWPGLVSVMDDDGGGKPLVDLSTFWFVPSLALMVRTTGDVNLVDWRWPLAAGAGLAALLFLAWLRAERRPRQIWRQVVTALVLLAWGWGVVVLTNTLLDRSTPVIRHAVVIDRSSDDSKSSTLSVSVVDPPSARFEDLSVSQRRHDASPIGKPVCLAIQTGFLGWKYVYVTDCQP